MVPELSGARLVLSCRGAAVLKGFCCETRFREQVHRTMSVKQIEQTSALVAGANSLLKPFRAELAVTLPFRWLVTILLLAFAVAVGTQLCAHVELGTKTGANSLPKPLGTELIEMLPCASCG